MTAESFDMTDSLAPASDQLDAVDLLTGPRTFTIERVSKGNPEQPFNFHLAEFPRPWRPGKSMRRVIVACWGKDTSAYVGRRVRLFCDPSVVFGGMAVGGTRIAALSHIDKPKKIPLLVTRGKSAMFTVEPLPDAPPPSDGITADQSRRLFAALTDAGMGDKAAALAFISGKVGREVASSKELARDEADTILTALAAMLDPADAPTLDGAE